MNARLVIPFVAGAVLAGGLAVAATVTAVPAGEPDAAELCGPRCQAMLVHGRGPGMRRAMLARAIQDNPSVAVVVNLRAIERVYRREQREAELPAFYRDVLSRTADPLVRNFVNYRLARLEMREHDAQGALEALMRNLDENLKRL